MIVTFDTQDHLLFVSPSYLETFDKAEDELIGKRFMPFIHEEDRETVAKAIANVHKPPYIAYVEERVMTKDGWRWQAWLNTAILNEQGKVESIIAVGRDINEQKQGEEKLRESEKELEIKNIRLEEMNAALKILLEMRTEDKEELEKKVMTNIKELVLPYVTKLKNTGLNHRQETFADIIQSNIEEVISPFAHKLSHKYLNFTPTELKVAYLVKQGLRTKEIAKLLGSSPETITRHRKSMRKKLKLTDKKSNLRTHLLSLSIGHIE